MSPIPKRKTERAPAIDKLLKPAIVAAVAMTAYVIMQGLKSEVREEHAIEAGETVEFSDVTLFCFVS